MYLHEARLFRTLHRPRLFEEPRGGPRRRRDPAGQRGVAAILFLCLFAAQSGQLALTPVLTDASRAFGVSTAAAGQIRTAAAVVAAAAALAVGGVAARVRLRTLLSAGVALVVAGAAISFVAPSVLVLRGTGADGRYKKVAHWLEKHYFQPVYTHHGRHVS
jgi:hypothetical protein